MHALQAAKKVWGVKCWRGVRASEPKLINTAYRRDWGALLVDTPPRQSLRASFRHVLQEQPSRVLWRSKPSAK